MNDFLNPDAQQFLLKLARDTIEFFLKTGERYRPKAVPIKLHEKRGAFVTLKKGGELRGCVGYIEPEVPLFKTVIQASILAATKDDRFLPVEVAELERLKIEISVLTLPRPIKDINEIEIGRHGIIIQGIRKGVFLPQVPTEFGWDRETYLSQCCLHKAYLPPDAWKKGVNIEVFEAQVFSE